MKKFTLALFVTLICGLQVALAQDIRVTGTVKSDTGEPLAGVAVLVSGTQRGVVTDAAGAYAIQAPAQGELQFSFVGMKTLAAPVSGRTNISITMESDAEQIDEVIVTAFGTSTKKAFTGSAAVLDAKKIEARPVSNAASALEGIAPGVQVNSSYGAAGSTPQIRIRGIGSINASSSPLYVVDGAPFDGGLENINPNDIESLTVLKDASSTSLYGSRAANGVVIITTKKGRTESFNFTVNVNFGMKERGIKEYDKADAPLYYESMWQSYKNGSLTNSVSGWTAANAGQMASNGLISQLRYNIYNVADNLLVDNNGKFNPNAVMKGTYGEDLDWYKPLSRLGTKNDYNMSAAGGSAKSDYFMSLGYTDEKDYIIKSNLDRFTARANVNSKVNKWLRAGVSVAGTISNYNAISGTTDDATNYKNPFFFARNISPIYPVYQHNGTTGEYVRDAYGNKIWDFGTGYASEGIPSRPQYQSRHVLAETELDTDKNRRIATNTQAYTEITFLKDFKFNLKGGYETQDNFYRSFDNAQVGNGAGNGGRARRESTYRRTLNLQQLLTWNKSFDKHSVEVLAGHESYKYDYDDFYGMMSTQALRGSNYELYNFLTMDQLYSIADAYRTEGFLSRAKYNYDSKYFLEASFRRDGSSKFSKDSRWGNFWSLGGAWLITSEDFMKDVSWVDMLKLRVSYGEVGNDSGIGFYAWQALYNIQAKGNSGATSLYKGSLGNSQLKWESNNQFDVAVEFSLFKRLTGTVEFFHRQSSNLLFDVNRPLSAGATAPTSTSSTTPMTMNIGTMYNRGIEVALDYAVVNRGDWRWNVGVNATSYVNKITKLPEQNKENGIINGTKRLFEGHGIYDYWLRDYVGVDPATGSALYTFDDKLAYSETLGNGDITVDGVKYATNPARAQYRWGGSAIPDVYGSVNSSLSWKNLDLTFLITYSIGGKIYDSSYQSMMAATSSGSGIAAFHKDIANAWRAPGDITDVPRTDFYRAAWYNGTSTRWLTDASYVSLRNVSVGYNLPKKYAKYIDAGSVRVYASGENLCYFNKRAGMDNQQSFTGTSNNSFVAPRTITFGIRASF